MQRYNMNMQPTYSQLNLNSSKKTKWKHSLEDVH